MSDTPRTGIGSLAAESEEDAPRARVTAEEAARLAEATRAYQDPAAQIEGFVAEMTRALDEIRNATEGIGATVDGHAAALAQLQGQVAQLERLTPQLTQWSQTVEARLQAMAQQISKNFRLAALDAAVKARGPGDPRNLLLPMAEDLLRWLEAGSAPPATAEEPAEHRAANTVAH